MECKIVCIRVRIVCITLIIFLVSGCGSYELDNLEQVQNIEESKLGVDVINDNTASLAQQPQESNHEYEKMIDLVKGFDYSTQEYTVNTDFYNTEMDQTCKEAFLEFIFQKEPVTYSVYRDGKEIFYDTYHYKFTENIGANWYLVKKDFVHDILYEAAYWYFDFDGDGMPELIFDLPGAKERPYILKYDSEKKNAYVFLTGDSSFWHFMGPGKLCYYNTSKKTAIRYGIKTYDTSGKEIISLSFGIKNDCQPREYWVWYHNEENLGNILDESCRVEKDVWEELTKDYFDAVDQIPESMTFDEIFGGMEPPAETRDAVKEEVSYYEASSLEQPEQDEYHKLYEQLKQIDYTLVEHSIRTDLYDQKMDRSCKEAFLNLIFHKVPAAHNRYWDSENIDSYYDCLYDIGAYIEDDFLETVVQEAEYWYLDFDGDGLPELIFEIYGGGPKPQILKYDREKQCAYLYLMGETYNWHFLSSSKLYYYNPTSMGVLRCGVKKFDSRGNETIEIAFTNYFGCDPAECSVSYRSVENPASIVDESCHVDEAVWDELTKDLLDAIDNKIPGMTFDEVFGDMAYEYIN